MRASNSMARVLVLLSCSLLLSHFPSIAGNILEAKVHDEGVRERYRFTLKHRDAPTSPFVQRHENRESFLRTVLQRDEERAESFREHLLHGRARLATGAATERRSPATDAGSPPDPLLDTAATLLLPPAAAGEYYTELYVGTPRQMQVAMVDLASDVVWLPGEPENILSNQNLVSSQENLASSQEKLQENFLSSEHFVPALFSPSSSSSFTPLPARSPRCLAIAGLHICGTRCRVALSADSATEFAYEDLRFNKTELRQILISLSKVATPRAAILGLGRGQTSLAATASRFAYCLSDTDEPAGSSLVFNGGDGIPDLAFTPLLPRATFHLVTLAAIKVHDRELGVPAIAVVLDMSTRFSRFPRAVFHQIVSAIAKRVALPRVEVPGFRLCYGVGSAEILRVPEVEFVFERNVRMRLPMENLFVAASERGEVVCLAMAIGEDVAVIGATQQQNFVVVVDRGGERVGFAPWQCASLPNL